MAEFTNTNIQGNLYLNNVNILDIVYPVGSVYMSTKSTNPSTLFGGTWEAVEDKILFSSGDNALGDTGGSKYMTSHNHESGSAVTVASSGSHTHRGYYQSTQKTGGSYYRLGHSGGYKSYWTNYQYPYDTGAHSHTVPAHSTNTTGTTNSEEYTNMPPYLVVYMWKRTA